MNRQNNITEFICEDCGMEITCLGDHDGLSVCAICRFIRICPDMPEYEKMKLRGQDNP